MGLGLRTEDEEENGMNKIWILHMEGKTSEEPAILCCFDDENAANALCDALNNSVAGKDSTFFVDDFALIKVTP